MLLAVLLACWTTAMNEHAAADEKAAVLEIRVFKSGDESLPYRLLKPASYDAAKKYPLVLFLHGAGERGTDNQKQLVHGIADFTTAEAMRDRPCFLVVPQCPSDKRWVEVDWSSASHKMPEKASDPLRLTMALLDSLEKEFSIDARRVYVTGLSMGGFGAWDAIQRYPKRFAAAIPICGGGDVEAADKLVGVNIWAFHGALDNAVKVSRSRDMIAAIKKAGGSPKYTEYPAAGHDSWTATYRDPKVHAWLFSQELSAE
jgi:predicted peptidase